MIKNYFEISTNFLKIFKKNQKSNNTKEKKVYINLTINRIFKCIISNTNIMISGSIFILIIWIINFILVTVCSLLNNYNLSLIINLCFFVISFDLFIIVNCCICFVDVCNSRKKIFIYENINNENGIESNSNGNNNNKKIIKQRRRLKIDFNWYFFFDDPLLFRLENFSLYALICCIFCIVVVELFDLPSQAFIPSRTYFYVTTVDTILYSIFFILIGLNINLLNGGFVAIIELIKSCYHRGGKIGLKNDFIHEFLKD